MSPGVQEIRYLHPGLLSYGGPDCLLVEEATRVAARASFFL